LNPLRGSHPSILGNFPGFGFLRAPTFMRNPFHHEFHFIAGRHQKRESSAGRGQTSDVSMAIAANRR
jgi:hypothetical protein